MCAPRAPPFRKEVKMSEIFSRTELLMGKEAIKKLNESKVAIFGIGGVGSYVVEGLARAGIGKFILVDNDKVGESNINRQIIATKKTIGLYKVDVAKERILDINPDAEVTVFKEFFLPDSKDFFDDTTSYIVDAIDTVTSKIELVIRAKKFNVPIISSMGTGNKLDPKRFEVSDIHKTSVCPLAKGMRKELKNREIENLKVVYSREEPIRVDSKDENGNRVPGSVSFVPSVAGLIIASEVVKDILVE